MKPTFIATMTVALFAGGITSRAAADESSKAVEAPKAAQKAEPSATQPADPKDLADAEQALRDAQSFISLLRDAADEKAYERMSADFRKENTAEKFAEITSAFREKSPMPLSMSVSGDVWPKPKDGGPPRASLRAGISRGAMFNRAQRGAGVRPTYLTISLVKEDGKWRVAAVHDMTTRDPAIAMGKAMKTDRKDLNRIKVSSVLEGTIVKADDGSLVLRLEGDPAAERTLKLDEQTAVAKGVEMNASRGPVTPGGKASRSMRMTPGVLSDIKAEHRASVETSDDGTRATAVIVIQSSDAPPSEGL